ncbi:benenodin family lasso peptide [Caulobacter soli]|nr:benenodin family lasso peptide [Caulobacter soli]
MERKEPTAEDVVIDLGAASRETRGPFNGMVEFSGHLPAAGVAED